MPARTTIIRTLARLTLAFVLALAGAGAWAASAWEAGATPVFRHAGVPISAIPTVMHQDRTGLIWTGSQNGLFRWDGYQLQRFGADATQRNTLPSSDVSALYEDPAGALWIASTDSGLARLDPQTGQVLTIPAGPQGLADARVLALAPDGTGGLWVGTGSGLNRVDLATGRVRHDAQQGVPPGLPTVRIAALLLDRHGNLWAASMEGLFLLPAGAAAFQRVPLRGAERTAEYAFLLAEDSAGRVWIGARSHGVFVREPTGAVRQLMDSDHGGKAPLEVDLRSMVDAGNGEVWLGTWNGIVRVDTATWSTRQLRHDPEIPSSLAADAVAVVFRDRSGMVWVAGPGLLDMTQPAQRTISTWQGSARQLIGGARAQVMAILTQPDGSVWLGSGRGGIDIIPPDRRTRRRLLPQTGQTRHALPDAAVFTMARTADGRVYIGTAKGLYVARDDGRRIERVELPDRASTEIISKVCLSGDRLWLGFAGLSYLDIASEPAAFGTVAALKGVSAVTLLCDSPETLWIGTSTGLLRYRPATGVVDRPWTQGPADAALPPGNVSSLAMDRQGRLWVAFYGYGVCRVALDANGSPGRVRCIGKEQGVPDGAADSLALDAEGNAWVSTDTGILRIDRDTFEPSLLQEADGNGLSAYWTDSVATTGDGDILFGSAGLTIVHPAEHRPWRYKAPLILTSVDSDKTPAPEVRLGPSVRAVQMSFALLDYSAPERVRYAYRLAGLEDTWTEAAVESRSARYTNVPPGAYTFEVKAQNRAGEWTTASWPLHVEAAWHETTPFRLLAGAAALLLLWGLVRLRMRLLVRRAEQLHEQVAQRTQELQQRTEQLEGSRRALRELSGHNARSLEEERKRVARELHDDLGQQLAAMRMEMSVLKARAGAGEVPSEAQWVFMRERVDRLSGSMRLLVAGLRPPALDGGLAAALEWLAAEYTRLTDTECDATVDPRARELNADVKTMIFRVAQESLNNILRHAQARHVSLQLRRDKDGWHLQVQDDGVGFDTGAPPRGFGLLSMEERAQLVGGTLRIDSRPGKGSCVHLHLPASAASGKAPPSPQQRP